MGSGWAKTPETVDTFTQAVKGEPIVASEALFRWDNKTHELSDKKPLHALVLPLLDHSDPGLRGRALEVVTETVADADKPKLVEKITSMLKDPNPYVRSEAASALADLRNVASASKLAPLLDDKEKNTYDISYTNLLGSPDTQHHDGSAWSRVDDAALWALQKMTSTMPVEQKFQYARIDHKSVDADIAREVARAKKWLAEHAKN